MRTFPAIFLILVTFWVSEGFILSPIICRPGFVVKVSPQDEEPSMTAPPAVDEAPSEVLSTVQEESNPIVPEEVTKPYPLDVPSPLLLSSSMILAISGTGSMFQLLDQSNGFSLVSAATVVLGLPTAGFLFYASILKAQAETEEDDKRFLNQK